MQRAFFFACNYKQKKAVNNYINKTIKSGDEAVDLKKGAKKGIY